LQDVGELSQKNKGFHTKNRLEKVSYTTLISYFKNRQRSLRESNLKMVPFSSNLKKPKKCLSAYMVFVKETRPSIVEKHPDLGALDIMKKVGEMWQTLQNTEGGTKYF